MVGLVAWFVCLFVRSDLGEFERLPVKSGLGEVVHVFCEVHVAVGTDPADDLEHAPRARSQNAFSVDRRSLISTKTLKK